MEISLYVCVHVKTILWKFRIVNQEFSSYLPAKFVNFLKSRLIFNIFYCFWMFVNKLFTYLTWAYLRKQKVFNVKSSTYYFHMKTKALADFQICISVPLTFTEKASIYFFLLFVTNRILFVLFYFKSFYGQLDYSEVYAYLSLIHFLY